VKFSFEKRVVLSKYHGRHTFCCFAQQKSAIIFLLIFADFADFQQTAKLLMKTLKVIYFCRLYQKVTKPTKILKNSNFSYRGPSTYDVMVKFDLFECDFSGHNSATAPPKVLIFWIEAIEGWAFQSVSLVSYKLINLYITFFGVDWSLFS
jgi:hypothetical protein